MTEIDYEGLFDDVLGAQEQEAADPATVTTPTGEEVQEVAEPAADAIEEQPKSEESEDGNGKGQSKEENAKYASIRRKFEAERDEAIAKAREEAKTEALKNLDETIKEMRMTNPYTRKPIESKAEYDEYLERRKTERAQKNREKLGLNEAEYEKFVSDLPEVQEARELKAQAEAEKKAAQEREFQMRVNEEIKNISMLDPSIKSIEDLTKLDNYPALYEKVSKGMSIEDAYKLVNFDRFIKQAGDKSKQAALNGIGGKSHLTTTQTRGQGAIPVPPDVREIYKALNPGITDAEISAHYNRTHKV